MIHQALDWVWDKVPWFIKWPVIVLVGPTVFASMFVSWHSSSIHATIRPYEEARDNQIKAIEEKRNLELEYVKDGVGEIREQNRLIYQELLRRR